MKYFLGNINGFVYRVNKDNTKMEYLSPFDGLWKPSSNNHISIRLMKDISYPLSSRVVKYFIANGGYVPMFP